MKQMKVMTFIYWLGLIYFAVRIMMSYLLFSKVESELIFQVFGFWSCIILLLIYMTRERIRSMGKRVYLFIPLVILIIVLSVVTVIYMTSGIPIFLLVSTGSFLLLLIFFKIFGSTGIVLERKKGRIAAVVLGTAALCFLIALVVLAFGYHKTDSELMFPIIGFWLSFILANIFFLSAKNPGL